MFSYDANQDNVIKMSLNEIMMLRQTKLDPLDLSVLSTFQRSMARVYEVMKYMETSFILYASI